MQRSKFATQSSSTLQLTSSTQTPCWQDCPELHCTAVVQESTPPGTEHTASKQTQRPKAHSGLRDKRQSTLTLQLSPGCVVEAPQKPSAEHVCPGVVQSESSEHGVPGPWLLSATQLPASQKGLAPPFSA